MTPTRYRREVAAVRRSRADRGALLAHHGLAGAAVFVPFAVLAPLLAPAVAPVVTLLVVVLLVLVPAAVWQVRRRLRREGVRGRSAVIRRLGLTRPSRRDVIRTGLPALGAACLLPGGVVWLEPHLKSALGIPPAWSTGWPTNAGSSPEAFWATAGLWLVAAVLAGPVAEELLFRGLLQPLVAATPGRRILVGSALFAVYHLWQPWAWPAVFLTTLPLAWTRERSGSTVLAAGVHVATNAVAWALLVSGSIIR